MQVEILNLERRFLKEIDEIEQDSFSQPWSVDAYMQELENPMAKYKVILVDGQVAAYGGYWQIFNEGHITNIAVKRALRKRGLGSMLVEALKKVAKEAGITSMTLEVRQSNASAIALYEKAGFKSVGIRPKYYPDGENAVIMWLEEL